jgi:hypothetical protein
MASSKGRIRRHHGESEMIGSNKMKDHSLQTGRLQEAGGKSDNLVAIKKPLSNW